MTSKDYFYLSVMAVAALVCYCHGFFSGVSRVRRIYDSLLGKQHHDQDAPESSISIGDSETIASGTEWQRRETADLGWTMPRNRLSGQDQDQDLHGDFGNN